MRPANRDSIAEGAPAPAPWRPITVAMLGLVLLAGRAPLSAANESQLRRPAAIALDSGARDSGARDEQAQRRWPPPPDLAPTSGAAVDDGIDGRSMPVLRRIDEEGGTATEESRAGANSGALGVRLAAPGARSEDADGVEAGAGGLANGNGWFGGPMATMLGALAVTLGVFAAFVAISRRAGGGGSMRTLPREAFEVIGQTPIGPRQKLLVVRCGTQALVIGVTPTGIHRVAQIDDPDEAGQLIASCRSTGSTAAFRETLREMEREPTSRGFVDAGDQRPPRRGLFLRA